MRVKEEQLVDNVLILHLEGRIDHFCADILADELTTILHTGCSNTIINLSQTEYLSAACLQTFLKADKRASQYLGSVCLSSPSPAAQAVLDFTAVNKLIAVFPDDHAAIKSAIDKAMTPSQELFI